MFLGPGQGEGRVRKRQAALGDADTRTWGGVLVAGGLVSREDGGAGLALGLDDGLPGGDLRGAGGFPGTAFWRGLNIGGVGLGALGGGGLGTLRALADAGWFLMWSSRQFLIQRDQGGRARRGPGVRICQVE